MAESVIVIDNLNDLLKEILVNYKFNREYGLATGYIESKETYDMFMSHLSALGYSYSVRSSHSRGRRPKTDLDDKFFFQYGGGKGPPVEFFGPLFSIQQVVHLVCAFGSKYYKKKRKHGTLIRKPRNLGVTKKLNCPAKLSVRCIKIYPEFHTVPTSKWAERAVIRDQLTAALKSPTLPTSVLRYYIWSTPEESHNHSRNHPLPAPTDQLVALSTCYKEEAEVAAVEVELIPTDHTYYTADTDCAELSGAIAADDGASGDCGLENLVGQVIYVCGEDKFVEGEQDGDPSQNDVDTACDSLLNKLKCRRQNSKKVRFQDEDVSAGAVERQRHTKQLQERLRSEIKKLSSLTYLCKNDSILEKACSSVVENCGMLENSWVREGSLGLSMDETSDRVLPLKRKSRSLYRFPELLKGWKSPKISETEKSTYRTVTPLRYPELLRDSESTNEGSNENDI